MISQDFKEDENGDLSIINGDIEIGESDQQHIADLIYSAPNAWKEFPNVGLNIQSYLSGSGIGENLNRNLKLQLIADGYTLTKATITEQDNELILDTDATKV